MPRRSDSFQSPVVMRIVPWLLLATVTLTGCFSLGGQRRAHDQQPEVADTPSRVGQAESAAPAVATEPVRSHDEARSDYRLAPRDQVVFEMFNEASVKTTQRLSSKGEMTLPLVGTVTLAGKTLREAEQLLRKRYLDGGYFVDPQVILSVAEYDQRYIMVLGQVNNPSRIELPIEAESLSLVEAITQAGGFTRIARTDQVQITRRNAGGDQHITVDLRDFLNRGGEQPRDEFQLLPGDVVFVRERVI